MNFQKNKSGAGFTLIELLVVIAIIGMLSAIVIASLGSSKTKASEAGIKSNFTSIRSQAELYYVTNRNFGTNGSVGDCTTTTTLMASTLPGTLSNIITDLRKNAGGSANVTCFVGTNGSAWAIAAALPTGGYACIDTSNVVIASTTGTFATAYATTTTTALCNR